MNKPATIQKDAPDSASLADVSIAGGQTKMPLIVVSSKVTVVQEMDQAAQGQVLVRDRCLLRWHF